MSRSYQRLREYLFLQEGENSCAVAAIRTVFALQFAVVTDEDLLEALGDDAKKPISQNGTDNVTMRRMVKNASTAFNTGSPWKLKVKAKGTIKDLKSNLADNRFPIVTVTTVHKSLETQLHAVVVLGIDDTHVVVHDPARAAPAAVRKTHADFLKWWTIVNGNTEFVIVTGGEPLPPPALES
jgi:hypothetical protein